MSENTPFSTTEEGLYAVAEPLGGDRPDSIALTYGDKTYTLRTYVGTESRSQFLPDVLLYEVCEVSER